MFFPENSSNYSTPERLVAAMGQLPPMAQVLAKLQRLLSDTNSGLDDIAALIRLDPAMTTRVIQISNSAWFGRGGGCRTIEAAVNRVGFREVYHVVAVAASGAIVAQPLVVYGRDPVMMWRESVACAFAAETLAERLGEDTAVAYMSGLLHAIGRLPINRCLIGPSGEAMKSLADEGFPTDQTGAEMALFGFTQADVGACMLERWAFAKENTEPVRMQFEPLEADEPYDRMSAILYCARYLRSAVCNDGAAPTETAEMDDVFGLLRLTRDDLLEYLSPLTEQVNRALQMMKL